MSKTSNELAKAQAQRAETLIHARGEYNHIRVRPHGIHLVVEAQEAQENRRIARLTKLGGDQYGLSFCRHTGRWEPMPFSGSIEQVVSDLIECLAPYLQHMDFPEGICRTGY